MAHVSPSCTHCTGLVLLVPGEQGALACPRCFTAEPATPPASTPPTPPAKTLSRVPTPRPISRPAPANPFSPAFLQAFSLISFLGKGAFGAVYLMNQQSLDRLVAVKVLLNSGYRDEHGKRLIKEGRLLARLSHPGILAIHDVGTDGALPYMVCEYVDGEPLADRLRRTPSLTVPEALQILIEILDALSAAHRMHVVHRDLKPENIVLTRDGRPKVCDFGLARVQDVTTASTVGFIQGTPPYMSPEQCRGDATGPAADLYSMGVIAFLMFTGQLPFAGPTIPVYLYQHANEIPPLLRTLAPDLPAALETAVARALAKRPEERFQDAASFASALRAIAEQTEVRGGSFTLPMPRGYDPRAAVPVVVAAPRTAGSLLAGRYQLNRTLGVDAVEEVWLAQDLEHEGAEVVVSLLNPALMSEPGRADSIVTEAHMALSLDHPGIAKLWSVERGVVPFLVSEHVPGPRLSEVLQRRRSTGGRGYAPEEAVELVDALAGALDHAHDAGVLHRDLRPASIVLAAPGLTPVLMDTAVGAEVARFRNRAAPSPPSHPPEQVQGQSLDARTDVYALAAVIHEMLTLTPPAGPVADAHDDGLAAVAGVPWEVAQVLGEALSLDRARRPARASVFAARYRAAVEAVADRTVGERTVPSWRTGSHTVVATPFRSRTPTPVPSLSPRSRSGSVQLPVSRSGAPASLPSGPRSRTPLPTPVPAPRSRPPVPTLPAPEIPSPFPPRTDGGALVWYWAIGLALLAYMAVSTLDEQHRPVRRTYRGINAKR